MKCGSFIGDEQFQISLEYTHFVVCLTSSIEITFASPFRRQQLLCKVYKYNGMQTWSSDLNFVIFKNLNILNTFECVLNTLLQTELATTLKEDLYFLSATVIFISPFKRAERLDC